MILFLDTSQTPRPYIEKTTFVGDLGDLGTIGKKGLPV
jgi:hypothetical protein